MKTVGIYLTDHLVRFGYVTEIDRQPVLIDKEIPLDSSKPQDIAAAIRNVFKSDKIQNDRTVLFLPRSAAIVKFVEFPASGGAELDHMVSFAVTEMVPAKPEDFVYDYAVLQRPGNGPVKAMVVLVQRETVANLIDILKKAGLKPDEIRLSTISLANQMKARERSVGKSVIVMNCDDGFIEMLFLKDGVPVGSRSFAVEDGGNDNGWTIEFKRTLSVFALQGITAEAIFLDSKTGIAFPQSLKDEIKIPLEYVSRISVLNGLISDRAAGSLSLDLSPKEYVAGKTLEKRKKDLVYLAVLFGLNLALIGNIGFFHLKAKHEYFTMLREQIGKIDAQASGLQKKLNKILVVDEYVGSSRMIMGLLSEVHKLAPAGIGLQVLDISKSDMQRVLVLVGQADSSDQVLKFANALKKSGALDKVDVDYITKRKVANQQTVDFEIKALF